jgi:hypothetical protein
MSLIIVNRINVCLLLAAIFAVTSATGIAQSPNTATIVVVVVDQDDALVKDARVTVINDDTGAVREAVSEGSRN